MTKGVRFLGGESIQGEENLHALQAGVRCPPSLLIFLPRLLELAVILGKVSLRELSEKMKRQRISSSRLVSPLRVSLL